MIGLQDYRRSVSVHERENNVPMKEAEESELEMKPAHARMYKESYIYRLRIESAWAFRQVHSAPDELIGN
jgi:hypothetical protein